MRSTRRSPGHLRSASPASPTPSGPGNELRSGVKAPGRRVRPGRGRARECPRRDGSPRPAPPREANLGRPADYPRRVPRCAALLRWTLCGRAGNSRPTPGRCWQVVIGCRARGGGLVKMVRGALGRLGLAGQRQGWALPSQVHDPWQPAAGCWRGLEPCLEHAQRFTARRHGAGHNGHSGYRGQGRATRRIPPLACFCSSREEGREKLPPRPAPATLHRAQSLPFLSPRVRPRGVATFGPGAALGLPRPLQHACSRPTPGPGLASPLCVAQIAAGLRRGANGSYHFG